MNAASPLRIMVTGREELQWQVQRLGLRGKMNLQPVIDTVNEILRQVQERGDQALLELTARYDHVSLSVGQMRVGEDEISAALEQTDLSLLDAMHEAAVRIRAFHDAQRPQDLILPSGQGSSISLLNRPLDTVGVYVPGGLAPLPSSVLMNIIPARSAGVRRVLLCTPPRGDGSVDPSILAAASIAGADEIYRIGGAQAIAAMAYGTATVQAVDKITGPGNIYVNTAKRLVFGQVDIDMFAGPSEILIIADASAKAAYVAADLLSQAEHDPLASALLLTNSQDLAEAVSAEVALRIPLLPRADIIRQSLTDYGAALVLPDLQTAVDFANELAPEHLELLVDDPQRLLPHIRNAGAVFVGPYSPEALGDYLAGTNHVLPTSGTARFFSPLNTQDFMKKTSVIHYTASDLKACSQAITRFAEAEHLKAHAESVRVRFAQDLLAQRMSSNIPHADEDSQQTGQGDSHEQQG
ncbi:MAG: histidinol dehydrogenase [Ruminococcaceae bacterium]|jgi:histidinol dehydrogenase|nr:histidinol dehydrogenase [Oscillospiraceae bacterium]